MKKTYQIRMWQTEDLPLFSGICSQMKDPLGCTEVSPWRQPRLLETCIRCNGSGRWGKYGYCPCEIGQQLRKEEQGR